MSGIALRLTLAVAGLLALGAAATVPYGFDAARLLAAADDPVRLADLAAEKIFTAPGAVNEIEAALTAGDTDLAQSFVALADERGISVDPGLRQRVMAESAASAIAARSAGQFVRGFVTGEPDDLAGLAGVVTGDLFVFGDIRDLVRETANLARGESADELVLGLACVGLAITAGTYATLGAAGPARAGISLVKAASRTGRMSTHLADALARPLREMIDAGVLKRAFGGRAWLQPALAVRTAREAVKVEKAQGLVRLVGDVGRVQAKAGTRAALDGIRIAESPKDVARLARLAEAKGGKTRALLKVLGRGAIALTISVFHLASWIFWAALSLIGLCVALKRTVERTTLQIINRRKLHRAQLSTAAAAVHSQ